MIQRASLTSIRQPKSHPAAQQLARVAPAAPSRPRAVTPAQEKAQPAAQALGAVSRLAAPSESLWYRLKKTVIAFFSTIDVRTRETHAVTADMAERVLPQMQPGDILLRRTDGSSGNLFIPSWWKHAGVYVGDGEVVDAVFKGIGKDSFEAFMTGGDAIMIVRPKNLSDQQRQAIANYAKGQVGKPYDFDFDFLDPSRFSCTELASHAVKAGAGLDLVEPNWFGAITGDGFKNSNFELVWTNVPEKAVF